MPILEYLPVSRQGKTRFSHPSHPANASPVMATPLPPEARVFQYAATASPRSAGASPRAAKGFLRLARASPEVAGVLPRLATIPLQAEG